ARSWVESRDFPVQTIRYEDMKQAPRDVFSELLSFLGVPVEDERLDRAVRFSSFGEMQRQETEAPFAEKSAHIERFFHSGRTGQWKDGLAPDDAAMLRRQHGAVMKRFGYL